MDASYRCTCRLCRQKYTSLVVPSEFCRQGCCIPTFNLICTAILKSEEQSPQHVYHPCRRGESYSPLLVHQFSQFYDYVSGHTIGYSSQIHHLCTGALGVQISIPVLPAVDCLLKARNFGDCRERSQVDQYHGC